MTGTHQMLLGGGNPLNPSFGPSNVAYAANSPTTAQATATFNTDGTCTGSGVASVNNNTLSGKKWHLGAPQAGIGSNYWFKVTPTSGSLTSNNAAAWTQGTVPIVFSVSQATAGAKVCTSTVEIATVNGGPAIFSASVQLIADRS